MDLPSAESQDLDDNQAMTSSYHEIMVNKPSSGSTSNATTSAASELLPTTEQLEEGAKKLFDKARHYWVGDLSREGIVEQEGQQVTYVAQDFTQKIKLTRDAQLQEQIPQAATQRHHSTTSISGSEKIPKIGSTTTERSSISSAASVHSAEDINTVINDIELEAKKLASSIDTLTENLTGVLHSLSSMTVDCTFVACDGVSQLTSSADASIKVMYQVFAKCEELNKAVRPLYSIHQQLKDTKRLLDKVEAEL